MTKKILIKTRVATGGANRGILLFLLGFLLINIHVFSQNVGIGTATPTKRFSVNGTIVVDHDSTNYGTLDSASLLFGPGTKTGISSNKNPIEPNFRGLDLWTNGMRRLSLTENGSLGINVVNPQYHLHVSGSTYSSHNIIAGNISMGETLKATEALHVGPGPFNGAYRIHQTGGNSRFEGNGTFNGHLTIDANAYIGGFAQVGGSVVAEGQIRSYQSIRADQYMAVGGAIDENYRLRVWDGNARVGGDFHATGRAAIGGSIDNNYQFRVNGVSAFDGNILVAGNMQANQVTTGFINGNGVVKSNGNSSLRIGFDQKSIDLALNPGQAFDLTAGISEFEGGNGDIRVAIGQFVTDPLPLYNNWHAIIFSVHSVDPVANTCKIRVYNTRSVLTNIKGTLYLTSVAKD